jgi:hypothetical protein
MPVSGTRETRAAARVPGAAAAAAAIRSYARATASADRYSVSGSRTRAVSTWAAS